MSAARPSMIMPILEMRGRWSCSTCCTGCSSTSIRRSVYVRNITDVDDKIIDRAAESGEPIDSVTARTTEAYHQDMAALNALPPDIEPRATRHIAQMVGMIEKLIDKGNAYEADGHVLFSVPSMPDYGKLSRRSRDEMIAGARVEVAPYKRDPRTSCCGSRPRRRSLAGKALGTRPARLAYRVLGHGRGASGRDLRHPRRRDGPDLPPPRERDRPIRLRPRRRAAGALLAA